MFGLGPTELIIIAVIILILFGAKRLPDIGKGLGGAIREFKSVKKEISSTTETEGSPNEEKTKANENNSGSLEGKVVNKVLEQVPGVKEAVAVKKKADKIKEIIK